MSLSLMELKNVSLSFSGRKILENFSLKIPHQKVTSIVGPSGCGKTSILRLLTGLTRQTAGEVIGPIHYGIVFQESRLLPWLTMEENIFFLDKIAHKNNYVTHVKMPVLLRLLNLPSENLFPHQLSGGMKMRVALARALWNEPSTLLFDEPFSSLDEITRFHMQSLLFQITRSQQLTGLFITHSLSEAIRLSDFVIVLSHNGKIQYQTEIHLPKRVENAKPENFIFDPSFIQYQKILHEQLQLGIKTT